MKFHDLFVDTGRRRTGQGPQRPAEVHIITSNPSFTVKKHQTVKGNSSKKRKAVQSQATTTTKRHQKQFNHSHMVHHTTTGKTKIRLPLLHNSQANSYQIMETPMLEVDPYAWKDTEIDSIQEEPLQLTTPTPTTNQLQTATFPDLESLHKMVEEEYKG